MNDDVVLEVERLSVSFHSKEGDVTAVRGVDFRLRAGEVLGIVGESGSGKSVTALAVMGLLPRRARVTGSVRYRGDELLTMTDKRASVVRGRGIAMIFQDPSSSLSPVYTVGDQIAEAVRVHQPVSKRNAAERAVELLELVGVPDPRKRATAFPHEYSGGMRQRVMIAIAIANEPDVIIADEPTTALDVTIQAQILDVLRTAREVTGAGIVIITHDLGVVAGLADRVQVMYAGKVIERGPVDEVFHRPRMPYTIGLLGSLPRLDTSRRRPLIPVDGDPPSPTGLPPGCPFAPRCPIAAGRCVTHEPELRRIGDQAFDSLDQIPELAISPALKTFAADPDESHRAACHRSEEVGRGALNSRGAPGAATRDSPEIEERSRGRRAAVLTVSGLVKHYRPARGLLTRRKDLVRAVDGISFDIRTGETVALVGESGSGKTTTLLEVLSLGRPQQGSIVAFGRDTATMTSAERFALRRDLQIVFQDPMASLDPRLPIGDILAEPLRTHGVPKAERQHRIGELLTAVGLRPEHVDRYPHELSGGQRQRIAIARALALRPTLLLLDEPVSALDVSVRAGIINLLDSLRARLGMSYLLVSHDLAVVRHIADRVAVMYLGRIVEIGPAGEVFETPRHPYTQALLSAIPIPDPRRERARTRILLSGDPGSPIEPPSGCRFRARCPLFPALGGEQRQLCVAEEPPLHHGRGPAAPETELDEHRAACHHVAPVRTL